MSHMRPKENFELKRQTMDLSDMRENLVSMLKMAYKKINSFNAATRKINAVMAILFMKRDKAKTDVESLARRLSAKIALLQSTFEKEIAHIVDQKVKFMEEQNQLVFDEICTLGEACVEAEKVLKIQNEDKLAKDGVSLREKFHSLLDTTHDIDELSDFEDSMFLQFVPGDLEGKFDHANFGHIYSSNRDSGISFSCVNTSAHLDPNVSPVSRAECSRDFAWTVENNNQNSSQDLKRDVSKCDVSDSVSCPPGFESEHTRKSPVLQYVSRPPNKALAQSSPVGKEPMIQRTDKELYSQQSMYTEDISAWKGLSADTHKNIKTESKKEMTSVKVNSDTVKLPIIAEKWEEEMCEIKELSSAMSVRLRKNIYDRMNSKDNNRQSGDESHIRESNAGYSQESWDICDTDQQQMSGNGKSLSSHVRRLFAEEHGSSEPTNKGEKLWEAHASAGKSTTQSYVREDISPNSGFSTHPIPIESVGPSVNNDNNQDDWWDAPVIEKKSHNVPLENTCKEGCDKNVIENKTQRTLPVIKTEEVDSWEELEIDHAESELTQTKSDFTQPRKTAHTNTCIAVDLQRSVSPSSELYSWGRKSCEENPDTAVDNNQTVLTTENRQMGNDEARLHHGDMESKKDSITPTKKSSCIISGRMKNLLKSYIESNKENVLPNAGDHPKTAKQEDGSDKDDKVSSEISVENSTNVESYKSKLMKDTNNMDKPEKTKIPEEKTFTTLGTVPSKSKPPDKTQLRKVGPEEDIFVSKPETCWTASNNPPHFRDNIQPKEAAAVATKPKTEEHFKTELSASSVPSMPDVTPSQDKFNEKEHDGGSGVIRRKVEKAYIDLSQLVFSGNSWSELPAKLVVKIGHLCKGEGDGFFFPIGVSHNSQGHIIVADNGNNLVKIIKDGVFQQTVGIDDVPFNHPSAVTVNELDEIYVKDNTGLFKFDSTGKLLFSFGQKILKRPYGLALTYNGYVVTLDVTRTNHLLYLFNQDGSVFRSNLFGPLLNNMQHSKCRFLEVFREKVLVSDLGLSVMYLGNLFGQVFRCFGYLGSAPGMLREPSGVTVDSAGNWIIADSKNDRIQVFSPNGQYLFPIKLSEPIYRPSDIMLTSDRHLLVVNYLTHSVKAYKLG